MSDAFKSLVSQAKRDARIVGVILGGSLGKGLGTARSDHDVYLVVADEVDPGSIEIGVDYAEGIDLVGRWTLAEFGRYAIGDGNDWNRYNFAHLHPTVDKSSELQALCDAKERLPLNKPGLRPRVYSMLT